MNKKIEVGIDREEFRHLSGVFENNNPRVYKYKGKKSVRLEGKKY